jgi:hypothetical protein
MLLRCKGLGPPMSQLGHSRCFGHGSTTPDYPDQRTSSDRPGWSRSCQEETPTSSADSMLCLVGY